MDIETQEQEFFEALRQFHKAGRDLCDAWDKVGADQRWPLPDHLKPPLSLDEWLDELVGHFHTAPEAMMDSVAVQSEKNMKYDAGSGIWVEDKTLFGGYAEPDPQGGRSGSLVEFEEAFGDQREIGESEGPFSNYDEAYKNLATLGLPVFDGSGCLYIDLGTEVYGLVDFDGGEYRVGLYFEGEAEDGGGVCANFKDFESTKAFIERLRKVHAPRQVMA